MTRSYRTLSESWRASLNPAGTSDALAPLLVRERGWGEGVSDHLGSTTLTLDEDGDRISELRYKAWGETRYEYSNTPTDYQYTGQRREDRLGLDFYQARWYDSSLGRFIQADTLVPNPNNPQDYNRYLYAYNNPLVFNDPTGHWGVSPSRPRVDGRTVLKRAPGLVFSLSVDVTHANIYNNGKLVPPGTNNSQKISVDGQDLAGLCGPASIAAIMRPGYSNRVSLNGVVNKLYAAGGDPDYAGYYEMVDFVESFAGWGHIIKV